MSAARYTRPAIVLHSLMGLLILGTLGLGFYMHDLPLSPTKLKLFSWHKWAGVSVALLWLVRVGWRLGHRPPPLAAAMPAWQKAAAHGLHGALYGLMIAIPLSGWLMSSAKGFQTVYFGVLPLPDLVEKNAELGDCLKTLHAALNLGLVALLAAHVGAALKHHLLDKDDTLVRMFPFLRSPVSSTPTHSQEQA